ncbi:MAG: hypothetical protein IPG77_25165 [Betaproteobacteria bacterium]|nr:hypothetical protein [Betaproteobacteria bacterium]
MPIVIGIFRTVPIWAWVLMAALAWGGYQKWSATRATRAAVEATERAAAEASAREAETKFANAAREASSAYARNTSAARRAADAARTERDRLLDAIAAAPAASAPAAACGTDDAAGLRQVLRECSGAIQELAAVADEDANRLNALQQWVKEVGAAK